MNRIQIIHVLIILLLAGCWGPATNNNDDITCKIATLTGPSSMGMIKLIDSIYNEGESEIQIEILNEPLQVRKMMLDGSADFAILPTTMASILYNKGLGYRLIAIPVWGSLYLVGKDTTISDWEDIRNKSINVMAKGMTPDVLFRHLLQKKGINPETDIKLDYSFPTHNDLANAMAAGHAELGVLSEPQVSILLEKNKDLHLIFDLNHEWHKVMKTPIAMTAFLGKESILENDPQLVKKIISSYQKSTQWVTRNPDSAASLFVKYNILPDKIMGRNSITRSNLNFVRSDTIKRQIINYLQVFYEMSPEIIGGKLPDENFFY